MRATLAILLLLTLSACAVGPDYQRPASDVPQDFKELANWKIAEPRDNALAQNWWQLYNDPQLSALVEQVAQANLSLAQAEAQYHQAQHLVQSAESAYAPIVTATGSFNRFRAATGQNVAVSGVRNLFGQAVGFAWEPDLWGSVRRQVEANTANAQASAATLQALLLSLQSQLVDNYWQLRSLDAQRAILDENVAAYEKTLTMTRNRYTAGVVAKTDVVQAEAQLQTARSQALSIGVARAKLEHAIAVLIGKAPAQLSIAPLPLNQNVPQVPVDLPSVLLERRPDIAAAERKMAATNAQIGVAKAAYFPSINLAMNNGFQSSTADTLFTMARRYWALGPAGAALTLFDGGAKNAQYKQAQDNYEASLAAYQQTVLTAFQEVEDQLSSLSILQQQAQVQNDAVKASQQALQLTVNQYKAGTVSYLNVTAAQTSALNNQLSAAQLQGARLSASVLLIKALGGGWQASQLPDEEQAGGERKWTDFLILPIE